MNPKRLHVMGSLGCVLVPQALDRFRSTRDSLNLLQDQQRPFFLRAGSHFRAAYCPLLLDLDTIFPYWFIRIRFFYIDKPKIP
jgi:hypothetical protein